MAEEEVVLGAVLVDEVVGAAELEEDVAAWVDVEDGVTDVVLEVVEPDISLVGRSSIY